MSHFVDVFYMYVQMICKSV